MLCPFTCFNVPIPGLGGSNWWMLTLDVGQHAYQNESHELQ